MATPPDIKRGASLLLGALVAAIVVAVAAADNTIADGDGATPVGSNPMSFGGVGCGVATSKNALIAINRVGGSANQTFRNDAVVTVSVDSVTGTGLSATVSASPANQIVLPSNWESLSNNMRSTGTVTSQVTLNSSSQGAGSGSVTYKASGLNQNGVVTDRTATMNVTWTTGSCAPSDSTPPVIIPTVTGTLGDDGWYTSDVNVTWTVNDPESTITSSTGCGPTTISTDTGGTTLTCSATSAGGMNSQSVTIKRDATAPTASASAAPAPNGNGWNNADVTVSFSGSDATSGIASCDADVVLSSEGAGQSASGTCTDLAGNVSASATAGGINIDKTAPTLSPTVTPNPVHLNGSATASPNATDALSGVASASCDVPDTSSVGSKTVSCTATDAAGNTATADASYSVVYNWSGFFQPVDNFGTGPTYVVNRVKAGSAVPLKFSLSGNQGLGILAAGYPKSQKIACPSSTPYDPVEETETAGRSSLSYDPSTDQYNYVWKTDKTWSGTCRKLTVQLNDGTMHSAYVDFTK